MAVARRNLASSLTRYLTHRITPSLTHRDRDHPDPPHRPSLPPPPPQTPSFHRSAAGFGSLLRPGGNTTFYSLPLGFESSLRYYSSSTGGGSNEIDIIKDVTNVLTDAGVAAASVPSPVVSEVAAAAADSFPPVAALQYLIDGVHSFTGLNWWAAIVVTTLLIRGATFPVLISQMKASAKLSLMRPELEELKEKMQNSSDAESVQESQKQMKALFSKHGVTPFSPLKGMFIQGPVFISFFFAIQNMVEKVPSFKGGGAFWFTDLTTPDSMYVLPVLTSLSFLATVELNMQEGMEGNPMATTMKNFSRVLALMTIPFTASFPKAIFCYWITSNLFSLGYGFAMKRPPIRKFLNLPELVPQSTPAKLPSFSFLGGSKQVASVVSSSSSESGEQTQSLDRRASSSSIVSQRIRNLEKSVKGRNKSRKR